jgi:hypothetical protein
LLQEGSWWLLLLLLLRLLVTPLSRLEWLRHRPLILTPQLMPEVLLPPIAATYSWLHTYDKASCSLARAARRLLYCSYMLSSAVVQGSIAR